MKRLTILLLLAGCSTKIPVLSPPIASPSIEGTGNQLDVTNELLSETALKVGQIEGNIYYYGAGAVGASVVVRWMVKIAEAGAMAMASGWWASRNRKKQDDAPNPSSSQSSERVP